MKARIELIIYGIVQGVTFRISSKWKAGELGIKGWVRNKEDGTVKLIAEGDKQDLQELIDF